MQERRVDARLLCADLVEVIWRDAAGREKRSIGNLEDISRTGVCIQLEHPMPPGSHLRILHSGGALTGEVRYAVLRESAHFLGIALDADSAWSADLFRPQHLLDPRELVDRVVAERDAAAARASAAR